MGAVQISLLGPPLVERDGAAVRFDTRKATALLALLAVEPRARSRDTLAGLLWPEHDPEHARGALRRTLSTVRTGLGPQWLATDGDRVQLRRGDGLGVDVERFRELLADPDATEEALVEAVALHRAEFLEGFALRDSVEFEDWQLAEADALRRELAGALARLVELLAACGRHDRALAHARRWLDLDPLQEPAHRWLIRLYAFNGDRAAALAQYRTCVRMLSQELGVPPVQETTELYGAVAEGTLAAPPRIAATAPLRPTGGASPPAIPLVGRDEDWRTLAAAHAASTPAGRLVVIEGEAGIGKTRLAEDFLADARARGAATASARCYEDEAALAYGPIVDALRSAAQLPGARERLARAGDTTLAEAARLVGDLRPGGGPEPPPLTGPGAQTRFFEGIADTLAAGLGGDAPGVLLLDDLHAADDASLDFLAYLVRRMSGRALCIVVTWRSERVGPDDRRRALLADAHRAGTASALELRRLTRPEVAQVASGVGVETQDGAQRLHRESEGLPYFLVELLRSRADGGDEWVLPAQANDLVRARLTGLDETSRQVLATAATIGRSFELDTVREASGRAEEETVAALDALVGRGILRELGDREAAPGYDFTHGKLRALAYEDTSLGRRLLLHRRVAQALVARARGRDGRGALAALVAHHFRLGGRETDAATWFALAGDHAAALYANAEALEHFESALALGHPEPARLHEACGDLATLLGRYGPALASYEAAAAHADPPRLAVLEHRIAAVHERRGDYEIADRHLEAALAALRAGDEPAPDAHARRAHLLGDRSLIAERRGDADRAATLADEALAAAEAAGDPEARARAHNLLGLLARERGEPGAAVTHLQASLALAEALPEPATRVAALNNLGLALATTGDVERALELLRAALGLCAARGDRHREAAVANNVADVLRGAGRDDEAMIELKRAVAIFAEVGEPEEPRPEIWKLTAW